MSKYKLPAIIFDVDGVLKVGAKPLPGALKEIHFLKTHLPNIHKKLPIKILSNGGGIHESLKAIDINATLGLTSHSSLVANDIILCHTPLKELLPQYQHKTVLTAGVGDCANVATSYGFQHIIALEEYSALFPELSRLSIMPKDKKLLSEYRQRCLRRWGVSSINMFPRIDAIFMMSDPMVWEENLQLISDLLISKNGVPGTIREVNEPQHVKFYMTNPDIVYADEFILPRIAQGSFIPCLQSLFRNIYNREFEYIQYGKPERKTFDYAGML